MPINLFRLESYSCKLVRRDKKLFRNIRAELGSDTSPASQNELLALSPPVGPTPIIHCSARTRNASLTIHNEALVSLFNDESDSFSLRSSIESTRNSAQPLSFSVVVGNRCPSPSKNKRKKFKRGISLCIRDVPTETSQSTISGPLESPSRRKSTPSESSVSTLAEATESPDITDLQLSHNTPSIQEEMPTSININPRARSVSQGFHTGSSISALTIAHPSTSYSDLSQQLAADDSDLESGSKQARSRSSTTSAGTSSEQLGSSPQKIPRIVLPDATPCEQADECPLPHHSRDSDAVGGSSGSEPASPNSFLPITQARTIACDEALFSRLQYTTMSTRTHCELIATLNASFAPDFDFSRARSDQFARLLSVEVWCRAIAEYTIFAYFHYGFSIPIVTISLPVNGLH